MSVRFPLFSLLALALLLGACSYTMKIQDGRMAYDRKQYSVAVNMLNKEYVKAETRVERGRLAFLLGKSYSALNKPEEAIEWYRIAYDNQGGYDALREYAYALKQAERYEDAMAAFRDLGLEIGSPYEYRRDIRACEVALEWEAEERREYRVTPLDINSSAAEYAPTLLGDDQLVITSDRSAATGDATYHWTGKSFTDLFVVDLRTNQMEAFDPLFNTEANEGTVAFSPDYQEVYFTRCDAPKGEDAFCKVFFSQVSPDGSWSIPRPLPFNEPGVNMMHPTLSADGRTLYFSAEREEGWGGYDLYEVRRNADGIWGEPALLSRSINTPQDEQFPHMDGDTLYFASSGHTGMGGLDIFLSYKLPSGNWAPPINLKPPINSGADDFGFVMDRRRPLQEGVLATGYFTTRRMDGAGADDIYRFEKVVPPPVETPAEPKGPVVYRNVLDVYVLEKIYEDPTDPNSRILGRRPLPGAELTVELGSESRTFTIEDDGKVSLELQDNAEYAFLATAPEYLREEAVFSSRGLGKDPERPVQTYELEIVLDKIFRDREIVLENIYYDYDEWYIRDDAEPTLNELADILELNPEIRIQLGSHTDCRGGVSYNETLSQRRAQAAVDYLISAGIDPGRLEARGYGEEQPSVDCLCARCTEEEHQANRRTTFKILRQ